MATATFSVTVVARAASRVFVHPRVSYCGRSYSVMIQKRKELKEKGTKLLLMSKNENFDFAWALAGRRDYSSQNENETENEEET